MPKRVQPGVLTNVRTVFWRITPDGAHAQPARVVDQLQEHLPQVAFVLEDAGRATAAFTGIPTSHWHTPWSNRSPESLNVEICLLTYVTGIPSM